MHLSKLSASLALLVLPCCSLMASKDAQSSVQEAVYLDFGLSFGSNIWPYIDWSGTQPVLKEDQMDLYLTSLFSQMKAAGQKTVYLSFAQLVNLDRYYHNNYANSPPLKPYDPLIPAYDVVALLLQVLQKGGTTDTNPAPDPVSIPGFSQFLQYFANRAHKNSLKVSLSFGGGSAPAAQFKILQNSNETYDGQATRLYHFMQSFGIDRVDFDMEIVDAISSQTNDPKGQSVVVFFKTLHDLLSKVNKQSTLTVMADTKWATDWLKPLFYNDSGQPIFKTLFHGLNIMAYSDTQFWLDPRPINSSEWSIEQWLDIIGKDNAGMVNIGFDDQVPYASPSANAAYFKYTIQSGSTDGQAAAQIYLQLQRELADDGYTTPLGVPFYWPSMNVTPNGQNRYVMTDNKSNFVSQPMQDFHDWLGSHQYFNKCRLGRKNYQ